MDREDIVAVVQAARAGDPDAFAGLVDAFRAGVRAVAYAHTGDAALSDEIVQQTFVVAWQRLSAIGDPARLGGWLRGVARRLAHRSRGRRIHEPVPLDLVDDRAVDVRARLEARDLLSQTLMRIPAAYREALVLFHGAGESTRAVSELLGISVEAATSSRASTPPV